MLRKIVNRLNRLLNQNFSCPVCQKKVYQFLPLASFYQEQKEKYGCTHTFDDTETLNYQAYSCPHCYASDRDRLYALYVSQYLTEHNSISLLEIAPSKPLPPF
jgi:hypothetical protein